MGAAVCVEDQYGGSASDSARQRTIADFQANRYDAETGTLAFSVQQGRAFDELEAHYGEFFGDPTTQYEDGY